MGLEINHDTDRALTDLNGRRFMLVSMSQGWTDDMTNVAKMMAADIMVMAC